jgi:tetratricopeptide (TPR) repeat protein
MTRQPKLTVAILAIGSATILALLLWPRSADREATPAMAPSGSDAAGETGARPMAAQRVSRSRAGERSAPSAASAVPHLAETLIRVMMGDQEVFKLSPEAIESFLRQNRTNAESLLAAYQITQDPRYLKLAAEQHPNEPLAALQIVAHNVFPEQQREWLDRFKALDPDNALANYLSARQYFQTAQPQQAIEELQAAATHPGIHDYLRERMQGLEELYLRSGMPPAEAKALGMTGLALPMLPQLNELAQEALALQRQYAAAGDTASAEALAQYQVLLARDLNQGQGATCLVNQRVGMAMERGALALLDPAQTYDFLGQSPAERLAALQSQTARMQETIRWFGQWLPQAGDTELIAYIDRVKLYGEPAAIQWLRGQQP